MKLYNEDTQKLGGEHAFVIKSLSTTQALTNRRVVAFAPVFYCVETRLVNPRAGKDGLLGI